MAAKTSSSRYMFYPLLTMLLLGSLWSVYWYLAFSKAKSELARQRQAFTAAGGQFTCGNESWGGYPFRFEYRCTSLSLTSPSQEQVTTQSLLVVTQAYNPFHIVFLGDGPTTLTLPQQTPLHFTHERVQASLIFDLKHHWQFSIAIPKLASQGLISADQLNLHARQTDRTVDVAGDAHNLSLTTPDNPLLHMDQIAMQGHFASLLLAAPHKLATLASTSSPLTLDKLSIAEAGTTLDVEGQVFLNPKYQLNGDIRGETNNLTKLFSQAAPFLPVSHSQQATIKTLLMFQSGGADAAKLKLHIAAGQVLWGEVPLLQLPPLNSQHF